MLTYHMNRLQNLSTRNHYCVTLNPKTPVEQRHVIRDMIYTHPIYTPESLTSQSGIHNSADKGTPITAGVTWDTVFTRMQ